jgi:hypothetical protein
MRSGRGGSQLAGGLAKGVIRLFTLAIGGSRFADPLQSRKYVYGYRDAQLSFVSSRLGQARTADPLENLSLDIPQ